jgi:membrane protein DedA with SNARE-associated domain
VHLDIPGLVDSYGYLAVAIGALLEGETVLALAGLAANRGYLDFRIVVVVAMICGFAGDQFYFHLGRHRGGQILARFPDAAERAARFDALLARWHAPLIIMVRFMYGFRIIGPVLLGMGRVPSSKFFIYNLIGAAIWAPLVAGVGYVFGGIVETVLHDVKKVEIWLFATIVVIGVTIWVVHLLRTRTAAAKAPRDPRGPGR